MVHRMIFTVRPSFKVFVQNMFSTYAQRSLWRRLAGVLALAFVALSANAQLANQAWPKPWGNAQNTGQATGAGVIPVVSWTFTSGSTELSAPLIGADGTVYLSDLHYVYALDGTTGALKWKYGDTSQEGFSLACGADGTLYIESTTALLAVNGDAGTLNWTCPSAPADLPVKGMLTIGPDNTVYFETSSGLTAVDPTTGSVKWSSAVYYANIAFGPDGTIYTDGTSSSDDSGPHGVYSIKPSNGTTNWHIGDSIDWYQTPIVGPSGILYVPLDGSIYALSTTNGSTAWSTVDIGLSAIVLAGDGTLYVTSQLDGQPAYFTALGGGTGNQIWSEETPAIMTQLAIGADNTVYGVTQGQPTAELYALNGQTGAVSWSMQTPSGSNGAPGIGPDGTFVFASGATLIALQSVNVIAIGFSPATVQGGFNSTGTVTLNRPAPAGGWVVSLSCDNSDAQVPATITVPAGQTSTTFTATTVPVTSQEQANVTAMPGIGQTATLTINPPPLESVSLNPTTVFGGLSSTGTVTLGGPAPSGGISVLLSSSNPAAVTPAAVTVAAGQTSATFTINTSGVNLKTIATITASSNGQSQSAALTIDPAALSGMSLNPATLLGGNSSTGTVTLSGVAGPGGTAVALTSGNAAAAVPTSVTVSAGKSTATFSITTTGVNSQTEVLITGTLNGQSQQATLTITPAQLTSISVSPSSVLGGSSSTGTATLNGPAGSGGTAVTLSSSNTSATVPNSVSVPAGQKTATFTIQTTGVNAQTPATITGVLNSQSQTATLTITPPILTSLTMNPASVVGGTPSTGTVTLSGPAAPGGTAVTLSGGNSVATLPATVTVASGQTTASFTVSTVGVNSQSNLTINATFNGASKSASLTVTPATLASLSVNPSTVNGGASSTGTVTLSGPAGPGGATVGLSIGNSAASVPTSVTVASGQKTATFTVTTVGVSSLTYATITANLNGLDQTATLTVTPPTLASMTLSPTAVAGIATSTGTITLSGPAGPGGLIIGVTSSNLAATGPGTVSIAAGQSSARFTVTTVAVTTQTVAAITATLGVGSQSASLTMEPIGLLRLSFDPPTVTGGSSSTGTATLNGLAPKGGLVIKLTSSLAGVSVPASVTVLAGTTSVSFAAKTTAQATQQVATVTAKFGTGSQTAALTVNPPALNSVSLAPSSLVGSASSTGTVTLTGPAPTGGLIVKLSSSLSSATTPTSVTVSAGKSTASFTVKTVAVAAQVGATIRASLNGVSEQATLMIEPPALTSLSLDPTTVVGGKSSTGTVTISVAAPTGGLVVAVATGQTVASAPSTVTIPAGKTSATFTVKTAKVESKTSSTVSATLGGASKTAILTISP